MALAAWDDGGYPGTGGSSTLVTGSIPDGHEVIVFYHGRNLNTPPFTHGGGLTSVTNLEYAQTGFGDDGEFYVYKAVKNGTGALTLTPSQTANSWWRAIVVDCDTNTVVDSNAQSEGLFDTTISYASPSMPAGGGTGVGLVLVCRGNSITLTAPTFTGLDVSDAHDQGNFRVGIRYGSLAIAASNTSTLTGSLGGSDSHYDSWVLLQPSAATVEATGLGAWGGLTGTAVATVQHEASALGQWGALTGTMAATVETPPAGVELIDTGYESGNGNGFTTNAFDTTGADFIVISAGFAGTGDYTISDNKGNAWHKVTAAVSGDRQHRFYYAYNCAGKVGTGHTFTIDGSGNFPHLSIAWYSGLKTDGDPLDQVDTTVPGFTPSITLGPITPTVDNELVIAGAAHGAPDHAITVDTLTMIIDDPVGAAGAWESSVAHEIQTTATQRTAVFTEDAGGSSTGWTGTIVSFKPFSGAPPAGPAEGPIKHMEAGDFLDNDVYVRVGGVWQRVDVMYRRESGVWVRYM
jgi:hypothetical protein